MELTKEIERKDELDEVKQGELFYELLLGQTVKETLKTTRGEFVAKFPKQRDILAVDRRVALMRGGVAAENFDAAGNFNLQKVAFLDVVIESGPTWFNKLKSREGGFSWGDMPDVNFVDEVYLKAWTFRSEVQKRLAEHEGKADSNVPDEKGVSKTVGDGVFSGVSTGGARG